MIRKLTLPNGIPFKTTSRFRYAVIRTFPGNVVVLKRSDNLATVRAVYGQTTDSVRSGDSSQRERHFLVDVQEGVTLDQREEDDFRWTNH